MLTAIPIAFAITLLLVYWGPEKPLVFYAASVLSPVFILVPAGLVYASIYRLRKHLPPLNRWVYVPTIGLLCVLQGIPFELPEQSLVLIFTGSVGLIVLTYPLGLVGTAVALPPMYYGITTGFESYVLAMPVYILAGYVQWYVALPQVSAYMFQRHASESEA